MSAVEEAVAKVKKLSPRQARELLDWLETQKLSPAPAKAKRRRARRPKLKRFMTTAELKAWHDSVRLTTDWEPPRMSDGYLEPFSL